MSDLCTRLRLVVFRLILLCLVAIIPWCGLGTAAEAPVYRSPYDVAWLPGSEVIYASDRTAGCVVRLAAGAEHVEIPLGGKPAGLALAPDGRTLYVARSAPGDVVAVDTRSHKITATGKVGSRPVGIVLGPKTGRLYVCNRASGDISIVESRTLKQLKRLAVVREPRFAALTPDENRLVVANSLPLGSPAKPVLAAVLSVVDTQAMTVAATIPLGNGATNLRGVAVDPTGRWAYCVHTVSRFHLPTSQLERGWMNTAGLSIIDLETNRRETTVLLDSLDRGAADPFGLAISPDGALLYVGLSGTHQIERVNIGRLHALLAGKVPEDVARDPGQANSNIWTRIQASPGAKAELVNDLMAMDYAGLLRRVPGGGKGPRGIALSDDGQRLAVANYFSGTVSVIPTAAFESPAPASIAPSEPAPRVPTICLGLGPQPAADLVRRGEEYFHDATLAFQHWQSCSTCHPDARSDGLRWDLLNDGVGNPKKTRSLVRVFEIKPVMSLGVRPDAQSGVRAGFQHILLAKLDKAYYEAVEAYLKSVEPEAGPLVGLDGHLPAAARRGRTLFSGKAHCGECHSGELYTDLKHHAVVPPAGYDQGATEFLTPRLVELYRTAPYLHDGRAATLRELLTTHNPDDRHGTTGGLTPSELDDLIVFLLTL